MKKMSNKNKEGIKIIEQLINFCNNQECGKCCFADDIDGHCMITDSCPSGLDVKLFKYQEKELL
jgi:hypothetical protein